MAMDGGGTQAWYDDERAWRFVLGRYLLFFGPMSLLWEIAQLPYMDSPRFASEMLFRQAWYDCFRISGF